MLSAYILEDQFSQQWIEKVIVAVNKTTTRTCMRVCMRVLDTLIVFISVAVLAEISLRSPRKLFILMINKYFYRIKVSKNQLI